MGWAITLRQRKSRYQTKPVEVVLPVPRGLKCMLAGIEPWPCLVM
jgi:hypothetical protein